MANKQAFGNIWIYIDCSWVDSQDTQKLSY